MKYEAGSILYNGKRNVLWGAGEKGFQTLVALCELDVYVDLVCDSNAEVQGLRFFNKKVVSPESILGRGSDYNIIVAVEKEEYVKEIKSRLGRSGVEHFVMWQDICACVQPAAFSRACLYWMLRDACDRAPVVYGANEQARGLQHMLAMLDVKVDFFLEDTEREYEWEGSTVKPVYDFLYERKEDYRILVTDEKLPRTGILDGMGLQKRIDYNLCSEYVRNYSARDIYILDSHLGYSFWGNIRREQTGFVELGEENGFTIVLLGGSTTDGVAYPFKSWGEILYGKFREHGYRVKICNGGCAGYKSAQELVKLVRDVIPMRPDVIVDYTGFNDANNCSGKYVFAHPYQEELLDYITARAGAEHRESEHYSYQAYTLGAADRRPAWQVFTDNVEMMHAICSRYGIRYCPFLQPSLPAKRGRMSSYERELVLNTLSPSCITFLADLINGFHEKIKQGRAAYLEDITSLLDGCDDVYLDICHVTEKGNERIAQYMFEYLTEKGIVKK